MKKIFVLVFIAGILSLSFSGCFSVLKVEKTTEINTGGLTTMVINNTEYYLIESEEDLRQIGTLQYPLTEDYMLNDNITLIKEWTPIGSKDIPFTGSFDGNGYTIYNMSIKDKEVEYAGFIGYAKDAVIHNIRLVDTHILASTENNTSGAAVAYAEDSTLTDLFSTP